MAVVRTDGHAGVDHLGDRVHDLLDLGLQLGLLGLQLLQAVSLGRDLLLDFLGLGSLGGVFLGLAHQRADLLGQLVAVCAQVAGLTDGGAVLGVKRDDLIDEGQLGVLELFPDVFLDGVRVFTDKRMSNIVVLLYSIFAFVGAGHIRPAALQTNSVYG